MGFSRFHDGVVDLSMTKNVKPRYADDTAASLTTEFEQFPLAQVADVSAGVIYVFMGGTLVGMVAAD